MPPAVRVPLAARDAILAWYDASGRSIAFRGSRDPYAILVSEAMAQQTQVGRAAESWRAFIDRFPTILDLAAATPADVLRAWRGLGYNRRALNLWKAARRIRDLHGGRVPSDLTELQALPGVGPYTARAVAAIAFGRPVGAVDTNVRRVIGRIAGGAGGLAGLDLQVAADAAVPADRAADWTHAVMDVGATFCRPTRPDCEGCPARAWCRYAVAPRNPTARRMRTRGTTATAPFPSTSRWLRGRILDRLRDAAGDGWIELAAPIGEHDASAVSAALGRLAADGLVELRPDQALSARLPLA